MNKNKHSYISSGVAGKHCTDDTREVRDRENYSASHIFTLDLWKR